MEDCLANEKPGKSHVECEGYVVTDFIWMLFSFVFCSSHYDFFYVKLLKERNSQSEQTRQIETERREEKKGCV